MTRAQLTRNVNIETVRQGSLSLWAISRYCKDRRALRREVQAKVHKRQLSKGKT